MTPPSRLSLKNILNMSLDFLQGLLATKQSDFGIFEEAISSSDLIFKEVDGKIRGIIGKKFSSREERLGFLKRDIAFHQQVVRNKKEERVARFLQAIFLPYDLYRVELVRKNKSIESWVGYFEIEEIKQIAELGRSQNPPLFLEDSLVSSLLDSKRDGSFSRQELFDLRYRFLSADKSDFIRSYLQIERLLESYQIAEVVKILPFYFFDKPPVEDLYETELLKFYLPFWLTRKRYFSNSSEFVFIHFQKRFCLWKIIEPSLV